MHSISAIPKNDETYLQLSNGLNADVFEISKIMTLLHIQNYS